MGIDLSDLRKTLKIELSVIVYCTTVRKGLYKKETTSHKLTIKIEHSHTVHEMFVCSLLLINKKW